LSAELIDAKHANRRELLRSGDELARRNRKTTFLVLVSSEPSLHPEPHPNNENRMSPQRCDICSRSEQFAPVRALRVSQFGRTPQLSPTKP
jgi:hypothetical protein